MAVTKVPREKMPRRTIFFLDARRELRSIGKGVNILGMLSSQTFLENGNLHDNIKNYRDRSHGCVEWHCNETMPSGNCGIPLFCNLDRTFRKMG